LPDPDAIVVGSGPNGLAAAIALARQGLGVRVLEAADTVGGGARSAELTLPGFVHDVCSGCHPMGVLSPFFRTLDLEAHGLRWLRPPASVAHPLDDQPAVLVRRSLDETARELGASDEERRQYNRVTADFDAKMIAQLRALYVEVTGDKTGADTLTPQAMETEIRSKVPDATAQEAYWRISHERAGLLAPPQDSRNAPAIERFLRLETTAGDEFERELGTAIGPDRARAFRSEHGGWGSRWVTGSDCPPGR